MKIWTYYYARIKDLPSSILPVSIAGWAPKGWAGEEYKKLAPKKDWFFQYKKTGDQEFYKKKYYETVLSKLDPGTVYKDLEEILSKYPEKTGIALVCYEKFGDFCHRHLVSEWLSGRGYGVCEEYSESKYKLFETSNLIGSYEKDLVLFSQIGNLNQGTPQEEGFYLTLRINRSKIYTCVNSYKNGIWEREFLDGSRTLGFFEEPLKFQNNER